MEPVWADARRRDPVRGLPKEMRDSPDPADATFRRLLNREILVSERRRMLILAAVQAFILALILLAASRP